MADHLKKIKVGKEREGFDIPVAGLSPFPPSFRVDSKQIPEITHWAAGETYRMIVDVRMTEKQDRENEPVRGEFDVTAYKHVKPKAQTDEEFEVEQGEALGGTHHLS